MKVQNWKRRRSLASLLAVPLMASSLVSMVAQPAFAGKGDSSTKSNSSSSSSKPAPAPAPKVEVRRADPPAPKRADPPPQKAETRRDEPAAKKADYSQRDAYKRADTPAQQPVQQPAQKTPDFSGGSRDAYKRADTQVPAQQPAPKTTVPATGGGMFGNIFGRGTTQQAAPPAQAASDASTSQRRSDTRTQTQTPAQKAPDFSQRDNYKRADTQPAAPAQAAAPKQVFKYDIKPAPAAPAQQKSVIPVPIQGLPQATVKTNSAPITTFNGKAYQSAQSDGKGNVVVKNEVTGKSTTFDQKTGTGSTTNKTGTVKKDFRQDSNGYVYNDIKFKGATGEMRSKQYKTLPTPIVTSTGQTRVVTKYVPRDSLHEREIIYRDTSSMDYLLMYMLINQANQNRYNGGGYVGGGSSGGSYDSSGGYSGGGVTIPAPPRIATGFEINWSKKFEVVPEAYHGDGTMTYKNPADAVAAYVSLDIINDNSEVPGFWAKAAHYATFGLYDHTKGLKKFEFDSSARTPLNQQVTMMAAEMLKNPEVDLKAVIDEKTGELMKDSAGTPVTYYFIVDPSNAMEVKDADTQKSCNLAVASILRPVEALVSGDVRFMKVRVLGGGRAEGSCKAKQVVVVDQTDLEEMNNDLAAKVDEAIHAIPKMSKPVFN